MPRATVKTSQTEDVPGQLMLFPALAGQTFEVTVRVDYPRCTDPEITKRLQRVGKRLSRGAVAHDWKIRKLVDGLESLAGLFDGVR